MNGEQDEKGSTSLYMDSNEEEVARKFLRNLFDIGTLCSFEELEDVEHPLLAGKIVKMEPYKSNTEIRGPKVMVLTLKEVFQCEHVELREFLVFFLDEAAEIMEHSELTTRDYLVIYRPILIRSPMFSPSPGNKFNIVLIVGTPVGNGIQDIYGRTKNMDNWHKLLEVGTESQRLSIKRKQRAGFSNDEFTMGTGETTSAIGPVDSDQDDLIPGTPEIPTGSGRLIDVERKQSDTLPKDVPGKETTLTDNEELMSADDIVDSIQDDVIPDSLDVQVDLQENQEHQLIELGSPLSRTSLEPDEAGEANAVESPVNTKDFRLKDIREEMIVPAVFGVIINQKEPRLTPRSKFLTRIEISDETYKNFLVEFYLRFEDVPLTLRQFDIIKLTNMKIKTYQNEVYGAIKKSSDVVTFSRENPVVRFVQTQSYEYTSGDSKRVKRLIRWMQNNVPGAQMFTPLCDIKNISSSVHLLGTVMQKKHFKHSNNLLIRLRDGTQTTQYCLEYDFSNDNLATAQNENPVEGSDFVDILVIDTGPKFRHLIENIEVGTLIEMYHVRTAPQRYTYKAKTECALKLYFKAIEKNIRIRETDSQLEAEVPNRTDVTETGKDGELECCTSTEIRPRKRKLFNADELVTFVDETNSNTCTKKTTEVKTSSKAADKTNSNSSENIQTKSTRIEQNPESTDEMNSIPRKKAKKSSEIENEDEEGISDALPPPKPPIALNKEKLILCSPCKVLIPRLENFSEAQSVPNSPEQERDEDVVSTTHAYTDLEKAVVENLCLKTKEILDVRTDIRNLNTVQNEIGFSFLEEWPHDVQDEFWIKVSLISTLPVITSASNDMDVLSLISAHCVRCKKYTPFFFLSEWTVTDKGYITPCPSCRVNGWNQLSDSVWFDRGRKRIAQRMLEIAKINYYRAEIGDSIGIVFNISNVDRGALNPPDIIGVRYLMMADLLVRDCSGTVASAVVAGLSAETFFDCKMAELITSKETQLRVKNFIANTKTMILKLKIWKTTAKGPRYRILARQ